jgi:DnaK suppressor protein
MRNLIDSAPPTSDRSFVQRQRDRLTKLRQQLVRTMRHEEAEQSAINAAAGGEAREFEDDAQRLALLEVDGLAGARSQQRLAQIERALQKIADGTYGLSDVSGKSIPRERLEAAPESIYTPAEIKALNAISGHLATSANGPSKKTVSP